MAQPQPEKKRTFAEPPAYFAESLHDAERLLKYACEMGITVDDDVRNHILEARLADKTEWDEDAASNLLSALAKLAARLKPVTAETLSLCSNGGISVRKYWITAICLIFVIVPFSAASFVASAVSNTVKTDMAAANDLSLKLREQLGPALPASNPSGTQTKDAIYDATVITELEQFASYIQAIDAGAQQLHLLLFGMETDPFRSIRGDLKEMHDKFQLPYDLKDFALAAGDRTLVYMDVRYFAQSLVTDVALIYGAITVCILPVLYALLGACAYLLRTFERQMSTRTYKPDHARFLIAGIGGAVVGLFNNFALGQGASIPPLAIAFLVGYAVDVFFAFLEGMSRRFTKGGDSSSTPQTINGKG